MRTSTRIRPGLTLIEVLVVVAILAVLIGLVLAAIQKSRESAALIQNKNNLRQIILGVHQLADKNEGKIEKLTRSSMKDPTGVYCDAALFVRLIPYVHGPTAYPDNILDTAQVLDYMTPMVKVYHNLADPSWDYDPAFTTRRDKCSYALNMLAMDGSVDLTASLPDGTSQTIAFVDKYFAKCSHNYTVSQTANLYSYIWDPYYNPYDKRLEVYGDRRATFADRGWQDVLPVTDPATRTARPSVPGKTFQVRPRPEEVDPHIPQAPHQAGLTVALFDGSVRTIAPSVAESVFWAVVSPAGGEAVSLD
jgi:prepilin-type N-terminal cleavage/methylation domain-containing protein